MNHLSNDDFNTRGTISGNTRKNNLCGISMRELMHACSALGYCFLFTESQACPEHEVS